MSKTLLPDRIKFKSGEVRQLRWKWRPERPNWFAILGEPAWVNWGPRPAEEYTEYEGNHPNYDAFKEEVFRQGYSYGRWRPEDSGYTKEQATQWGRNYIRNKYGDGGGVHFHHTVVDEAKRAYEKYEEAFRQVSEVINDSPSGLEKLKEKLDRLGLTITGRFKKRPTKGGGTKGTTQRGTGSDTDEVPNTDLSRYDG